MGLARHRQFFRDVSARANYADVESVSKIYYAILKTILLEVKKSGTITIPDFGRFYLMDVSGKYAPRLDSNGMVVKGEKVYWPPTKAFKFSAGQRLKDYFKD